MNCPNQHGCLYFRVSLKKKIKEFQNRRMVGVGRDLWGSSSPTPLPKQMHLEQVTQYRIQDRVYSTTPLSNLLQCSVTHRVEFFLMFRWNF